MTRIALLSALSLLLSVMMVGELACSRTRPSGRAAPGWAPGPRMPDPFPLPAEPALAAHITNPGAVWANLAPIAGASFDRRWLIGSMLEVYGAPELTDPLVVAIDFDRPWSAVQIGDEIILHLSVLNQHVPTLQKALAGRAPVGDFGAVRLNGIETPPQGAASANDSGSPATTSSSAPPRVAWLDTRNSTLTLAHGLRGIATGQTLGTAYGKDPLFLMVSVSVLDRFGVSVPVERVSLRGANPNQFEARFESVARSEVPALAELAPGALTGLLHAPQVIWGASSRWARHEQVVQDLIHSVRREVAGQNFLIRGILEELSRRLDVVLRAWDGRMLAAGGPRNHLLVALGTDAPDRAENAVLHLAQGVVDNLKLASTFGIDVPDLVLQRAVAKADGHTIHRLTLRNAATTIPRELSMLLDQRRALHLAFTGSKPGSSAMAAAGPQAPQVLAEWLRGSAGAPPAKASRDHLAAVTWAVDPGQVRTIMAQGRLQDLLTIDAGRAPAVAVLREVDRDFVLDVGPPRSFDE